METMITTAVNKMVATMVHKVMVVVTAVVMVMVMVIAVVEFLKDLVESTTLILNVQEMSPGKSMLPSRKPKIDYVALTTPMQMAK